MNLRTLVCAALPAAVFLASNLDAGAGTFTWTGGGADNNWGTAANWLENAAPTTSSTSDTIVFNGNSIARLTTLLLSAGVSVNQLKIESTLANDVNIQAAGQTLTIGAGGIDMSAAVKKLTMNFGSNNRLTLGASQTWDINSQFTLQSTVADSERAITIGSGQTLTKAGAGTLVIGRGMAVGGAGTLLINAGKVSVETSNVATDKSALNANVTIGSGAALEFKQANAAATNVINASGDITVAKGGKVTYTGTSITTAGTVILSGAAKGNAVNSSTIELRAGTTNINISGTGVIDNKTGGPRTLGGTISGTSTDQIIFDLTGNNYTGGSTVDNPTLKLTGDNSNFAGTFSIYNGRHVSLDSSTAGSAKAKWALGDLDTGAGYVINATDVKLGEVEMTPSSSDPEFIVRDGKSATVTSTGGRSGSFIAGGTGKTSKIIIDGTLTVETQFLSKAGTTNVTIGANGIFNANQLAFDGTANTTIIGGRMNIGSGGVTGTTGTLTLGTVTVGAYADWTGEKDMVLQTGGTTTFDTLDSGNGTAERNITISGVISGNGALTKTGAGTLDLTGANTYEGATTVTGGTLKISGTGSINNSNITVSAGGTLLVTSTTAVNAALKLEAGGRLQIDGSNAMFTNADFQEDSIISGNGTLQGASQGDTFDISGMIAPGNAAGDIGTLTLGGSGNVVTFTDTAKIIINVTDASNVDMLIAGGDLVLDNVTVELVFAPGYVPAVDTELTLFGGDVFFDSQEAQDAAAANITSNYGGSFEWLEDVNGNITGIKIMVIPEPSTYALLGAGVLAGLALVRRRKRA